MEDIESLVTPGETASFGKMKSAIQYAYFDEDLFLNLCTEEGRTSLFNVLRKKYL